MSVKSTQAHLVRPSKFANGRVRDWSFYVFFRILSKREMARTIELVEGALTADTAGKRQVFLDLLRIDLVRPRRMNHSIVEKSIAEMTKPNEAASTNDDPSQAFLNWLQMIASADADPLVKEINGTLSKLSKARKKSAASAMKGKSVPEDSTPRLALAINEVLSSQKSLKSAIDKLMPAFAALFATKKDRSGSVKKILSLFGKEASTAGIKALEGGLPVVGGYEVLRQFASAVLEDVDKSAGLARLEEMENKRRAANNKASPLFDSAPINIAFTAAGLNALALHDVTLKSFPEAFREGMAARAGILGDTESSAPEYWEGELGQDGTHGYFTGGFQVGDKDNLSNEKHWKRLRAEVAAFNNRTGEKGEALRMFYNGLFRLFGMEIVQLELAQDPYFVSDDDKVIPAPYRMEHFGFRDGLSQPFVDMKLGDPPPGGGTPSENRSWAPLAAGEIILGEPDEDGQVHNQPNHPDLRDGGTFVVFRKLEQDVAGFRKFLAAQRPDSSFEQKKLAAQFMGRWQDGTSLVHSPDFPGGESRARENTLNDFLYAADDPQGAKCPLSSHVRRANPRDLGGNSDIRRHRIMRRGMSYGGPLLDDDTIDDGERRGMYFIAANARIDLQFEVVQANWMNKDGFSGQAGLARCPITGANNGDVQDSFLEAGAGVPITRLPRFVITKGGDYFFAPGIPALRKIAAGEKFFTPAKDLPYDGQAMGDGKTPVLFDEDRLTQYVKKIISPFDPTNVVRVQMPAAPTSLADEEPASTDILFESGTVATPVTFLAHHQDVKHVLENSVGTKPVFTAPQYAETASRMMRGGTLLQGSEIGSSHRARLLDILNTGWATVEKTGKLDDRLNQISARELNKCLRRSASTGELDLVDDMAAEAAYAAVSEIVGVEGPDHLTEMAMAVPFARQHIGQVYPDWLTAVDRTMPDNRAKATMMIWSGFLSLDMNLNHPQMRAIKGLALQAAGEFLSHLDRKIAAAVGRIDTFPNTLLKAFIVNMRPMCAKHKCTPEDYISDIRSLLFEVSSSSLAMVPQNFADIMDGVFDMRLDLPGLLWILDGKPQFPKSKRKSANQSGIRQLIHESLRLKPTTRLLMRRASATTKLPSGGEVKKDDWVASIVSAANLDVKVFNNSQVFSLDAYEDGERRNPDDYLPIGSDNRDAASWDKDNFPILLLENCVRAAAQLKGLRPVAGPDGEVRTLFGIKVGLKARFSEIAGVLPE